MEPNSSFQSKEVCSICSEIFKDPVQLKCGHSCCKSCLVQHGAQKLERQECSSCENAVGEALLNQALKAENNAFMEQSERFCSVHGEEHLLLCKEDEKVICTKCSDEHRSHQTCTVGEVVQQMKEHLEEIVKPIKIFLHDKANKEYEETAKRMKIQAQETEKEIKKEFNKIQNYLKAKQRALSEATDIEKMNENIENISKEISTISKEIEETEKELDGDDIAFLKNLKTIKKRVQSNQQDLELISGRLPAVSKHIDEVKSLLSTVKQIMPDIEHYDMEKTADRTGDSEDLTSGKSSAEMNSISKATMKTKELKGHEKPQKLGRMDPAAGCFSPRISKQNKPRASNAVHVLVSGKTWRSHQTFMKRLDMSLEVCNLEDCGVVLIFCTIFQLEADIKNALRNVPDNKPIILVLTHHSYTPDHVDDIPTAPPRSNVVKMVQCVFHETVGLLECEFNQRAVTAVRSELKNYCTNTAQVEHVGGLK